MSLNISLSVGQSLVDESFALRAHDLFTLTTDLQPVILSNKSLLARIYFLTKTYVVDPVVDTQKNRLDENGSFERRKQMLKLTDKKIFTILR